MKPTFSPESTAELQRAIDILEGVYRREMLSDCHMQVTKLSNDIGSLMFIASSTSTRPEAMTPEDYVRLIVLDEVPS